MLIFSVRITVFLYFGGHLGCHPVFYRHDEDEIVRLLVFQELFLI